MYCISFRTHLIIKTGKHFWRPKTHLMFYYTKFTNGFVINYSVQYVILKHTKLELQCGGIPDCLARFLSISV